MAKKQTTPSTRENSTPKQTLSADVTVIGGGIAGLVAARTFALSGLSVIVVEERAQLGGALAKHQVGGLDLDAGAESFATRGGVLQELLQALDLTQELVSPQASGWIQYGGNPPSEHAKPLPATGVLGIPSDVSSEDVSAVIGKRATLLALKDNVLPAKKLAAQQPLSVAELVEQRMGKTVLEKLVRPIVGGVYSAQPEDLDADLALPGIRKRLLKEGSLAKAVAQMRASAPAGSAVGSLRGGMYTLVDALGADVKARGVKLLTRSRAVSVRAEDGGWQTEVISVATPEGKASAKSRPALTVIKSEGLFIATTEKVARELTGHLLGLEGAPEARGKDSGKDSSKGSGKDSLAVKPAGEANAQDPSSDKAQPAAAGSGGASAETGAEATEEQLLAAVTPDSGPQVYLVTLVVDKPELDHAPRGSGVLVAPEARAPHTPVKAKALTHMSAKWAWVGEQAGPGTHVLRLSYGAQGEEPQELSATQWTQQAVRDAAVLLDCPLSEADVIDSDVISWEDTIPLARLGHAAMAKTLRKRAATVPGLALGGAWLAGTGLARVIPDTQAVAGELAESLGAKRTDVDFYAL